MEFKELKTKSKQELVKLVGEQKEMLRDMRFKAANRKLKKFSDIGKARVLIARIKTLLNRPSA